MAGKIPNYLRDYSPVCRKPKGNARQKPGERDWCHNCGKSVWRDPSDTALIASRFTHKAPKAVTA
jgi:hypothetical protein